LDDDVDVKNRQNRKINEKKTVQGIFYNRSISCNLITFLTHMVAVYIIITGIIIKSIRGTLYLRRRPLSFKLIYTKIISKGLDDCYSCSTGSIFFTGTVVIIAYNFPGDL